MDWMTMQNLSSSIATSGHRVPRNTKLTGRSLSDRHFICNGKRNKTTRLGTLQRLLVLVKESQQASGLCVLAF
jgi:hypothetical protein